MLIGQKVITGAPNLVILKTEKIDRHSAIHHVEEHKNFNFFIVESEIFQN